jgi:hypothetical protein
MTYLRLIATLAVLALSSASACGQAVKPLPDKNTNWLKACDADAECGSELACLCGACTKACSARSDCRAAALDAVCVAAADPSVQAACGLQLPAAAICSAPCARDRDCDASADGLICRFGLCVTREAPGCDASACEGFACASGRKSFAECDAEGRVSCSCVPDAPVECEPGDVIAKICSMDCPGLNHTAFATCGADGHYGPCTCQDPKCGPATDCVAGYTCLGNRCLEAANHCVDIACEAGATCIDSLCIKVLADGQSSPADLAIADDGQLYFVNTGTYDPSGQFNFDASLMRVPADGSELASRVTEDLNEIGRMTLDRGAVYWFSRSRDGVAFQVMRADLPDGPTNAQFNTGEALSPLVADADALFWIERKPSNGRVEIMRVPRDNSAAPSTLLELPATAGALARSGDRLYWGSSELGLWSASKDGSDARRVVASMSELKGPFELAVDSSGVHWSWIDQLDIGLGQYAEASDVNVRLTESMRGRVLSTLALDDTHVYWVFAGDGDEEFQLSRTSKVPFATDVVWRSPQLKAATRILVRAGFLYVTLAGDAVGQGKVIRIQVPSAGR